MNIGALLFGAAMLVVTIPFVLNPFLQEQRRKLANPSLANPSNKGRDLKDGQTEVLTALRDLEFDFQTGKVTEEDYQNLRLRLMAEAAALIEQEKQAEARIESQIQERRAAASANIKCKKCGANLRQHDLYCPKCGQRTNLQVDEKKCASCGKQNRAEDHFCTGCGANLTQPSAKTMV